MPELNTIAPKKWPGNYGGLAPTLTQSADNIRVGDIAVDTSVSPQTAWACQDADTPIWVPIGAGRNYTKVFYLTSSNTPLTPLTEGGMYYVDSDSGNLDIYIEDSTPENEGKVFEFRKPNLTTSYNTITLRTPSGQAIGPSTTMVLQKPSDNVSLVANNYVAGGAPGRKYRQITDKFDNPQIITVGPAGEQFTSVVSAIAFANNFATSATDIKIQTGTYEISSTITITNAYIRSIQGESKASVTIKPEAGLVGSPIFDIQVPIEIEKITFDCSDIATYKTTSGGTALKIQGYDSNNIASDCDFINCNMGISVHGIQLGGTHQNVKINGCLFQGCTNSLDIDSGSDCAVTSCRMELDVVDKYAIYVHNSTTQGTTALRIDELRIFNPNTGSYNGEGIKVEDNSIFYAWGLEIQHIQEGLNINNGVSSFCAVNQFLAIDISGYGIKLNNGSNLGVNDILIDSCNIGVDVGPASGGNTVYGFSVMVNDSTSYDIAQRNSTDIIQLYNCRLDRTKMLITNSSNYEATFFDTQAGDRGFKVYGELAVGSPELGKESVLGGGDSYTRGMLVYTYDAGTGTYTDISESARSATGSTFTFTGTDANDAIYVASDLIGINSGDYLSHLGIKASINTSAVYGSGSIVAEYWASDESSSSSIDYSSSSSSGTTSSNWKPISVMDTDGNAPYYSYSKNLFVNNGSHQIRYNNNLTDDKWGKNDPPSTGTDRRWVRFRIVDGITTAPVFEQFKLHTSRSEVNSDGFIEYFGKARPVETLPWDLSMIRPASSSPGNQDLYISKNIVIGREFNLMGDNDKVGFMRTLPQSLDTSTPIKFKFSFVPETTDTVTWKIYWAYTTQGDNVYTNSSSAPSIADTEQSKQFSILGTAGKESWGSVDLDISAMTSFPSSGLPDNLWINLQKISGDGVVALVDIDAQYTKWNNGGAYIE